MNPSSRDAAARALFALGLEDKLDEPDDDSRAEELPVSEPMHSDLPPVEGEIPPLSIGEQAGDRIGRYVLVRPLGEGGFGVVWLAHQTEPIRRELALKLLKPGMDSREIIARFRAEQQSLALMAHPNIAGVLDAGAAENGHLFFVMEWVDGLPLTEHCDARRLGIEERLALFLQICDAVRHAHLKGIIHRDLKPSNLLVAEVDTRAVPKVIDFGVAKAIHGAGGAFAAGLTRTAEGIVVGTPQYMSPEQAGSRADIDVRSDVYSLGAVLHELLTGVPPLGAEDLRETPPDSVLKRIREEEVAKPSSRLRPRRSATGEPGAGGGGRLDGTPTSEAAAADRGLTVSRLFRILQGELDWIVLRALEKERERRYQSVEELAADLRRHLAGEAVMAGPRSSWYRFRKFARRRRGPILAAAAGTVALMLGLVLASWQAVRATTAERIAESRLEMAEQARDAAQRLLEDSVAEFRRSVAEGRSGSLAHSIEGPKRFLESLPEVLEDRTVSGYRIYVGLGSVADAAFAGQSEETKRHLDELLALVDSLEKEHLLSQEEEVDLGTALMLGAHATGEARDFEASSRYRKLLRARAERWLTREPDAPWALASLSHEAAAAALEAALATRIPTDALPHLARLKQLELRLARKAPLSIEHLQAKGLNLFCGAFAAHHLGANPSTVIGLFEDAAATFRIAYAKDDGNPYRVVFFRDLQLGAETAAGTRLLDLGVDLGDPAMVERGRNLVLDAYGQRLELAKRDPNRLEWWKDLAGSCKQLVKLATFSKDPLEAEKLLAMAGETARLFPETSLEHPATARALCEMLADFLEYRKLRLDPWDQESAELLLLALDAWFRGAARDVESYNLHKYLERLTRLVYSISVARPPVAEDAAEVLRAGLGELLEHTDRPANAAVATGRTMLALKLAWPGVEERTDDGVERRYLDAQEEALELARRLRREEPSTTGPFLVALLSEASEDLRLWTRRWPSERRPALAERASLLGERLVEEFELAARENPDDLFSHLSAWAAWKWSSAAAEFLDIHAAEEPHQRMVERYRAAERFAGDKTDEQRIFYTILGPHLLSLDRRGVRLLQAGREAEARSAFAENVRIRESRQTGRSPFHYTELSLNHLRCGLLCGPSGKREEVAKHLDAARRALGKVRGQRGTSRNPEVMRLAMDLLERSLAPERRDWNKEGAGFASLLERQTALLGGARSHYEWYLVDLAWARCADATTGRLPREDRDHLLRGWTEARKTLLQMKLPKEMEDTLRPLPEQ